jgi:hypothetical protein
VPVEKERAWAKQCGEVHRRVGEKLAQLLLVFKQVSTGLEDIKVVTYVYMSGCVCLCLCICI